MSYTNHRGAIARLAESEGVFTTAQARRAGVPRDALHDAVDAGFVQRIMHGAYRMTGSGASYADELVAIWKLTAPSKFTYERLQSSCWDGIAVGGSTAASLLELGNLHLSPYRIYAPKRINSRNPSASFARRTVSRNDAMFTHGVLATRPERTVFDLVIDDIDYSLIADVLRDAAHSNDGFDFEKLKNLLSARFGKTEAEPIYHQLLSGAGLPEGVRA